MASYLKAEYWPVGVLLENLICDLLCICITINVYKKTKLLYYNCKFVYKYEVKKISEINSHQKIFDALDEISHKPNSL